MQDYKEHDAFTKVLVVDDDPVIRRLACQTFEQLGFLVEEAADGHEGFAAFEREKPNLILLDVMISGMDGFSLCREIRAHPDGYNTVVMIMTSNDDMESIRTAYEVGATDFITKPINWPILGHRSRYMIRAKQAEEQIRYLAMYDNLTGLPNRILFRDRVEQAMRLSDRLNQMHAIMFIDLDNFKDINDSLGHTAGDTLLQVVAQRFRSTTRETDTVARLGGDEFSICLPNLPDLEAIDVVAGKIMDIFSGPFLLGEHRVFITPSVGIAIYPNDAKTVDDLLKQADSAMYYAKEQGKNHYQFFSSEMQVRTATRLTLHNEMRGSIERKDFILHYQPKFETSSGRLCGMEALVRWKHPAKGMIPPDAFIPVAESTGLIVPLGEWVLTEACGQVVKWQEMGYQPVKVAVNFSPVQFRRSDVLASISKALKQTGLDPSLLEIELTESTLMQSRDASMPAKRRSDQEASETLISTLFRLREMGISIAMDDFGTGYSSLSYLSKFPIDVLKIDRSFVNAMDSHQGTAIISAIIAMAHKLGIRIVAEGVETDEQRKLLDELGCDELQGYLLGKPVPAAEFDRHLIRHATGPLSHAGAYTVPLSVG